MSSDRPLCILVGESLFCLTKLLEYVSVGHLVDPFLVWHYGSDPFLVWHYGSGVDVVASDTHLVVGKRQVRLWDTLATTVC